MVVSVQESKDALQVWYPAEDQPLAIRLVQDCVTISFPDDETGKRVEVSMTLQQLRAAERWAEKEDRKQTPFPF
jgi:hypothetical protein